MQKFSAFFGSRGNLCRLGAQTASIEKKRLQLGKPHVDNLNDYKNAKVCASILFAFAPLPKCERGHVPEFRNIFVNAHLQTFREAREEVPLPFCPDRGSSRAIVSSNRRLNNGKILTHGTFPSGTAKHGTPSPPYKILVPKVFHRTCSKPDPKVQQKGRE